MKLTRFARDEVFYRYLTPRWAYMPLSGQGAAMNGGRFNRPGVEALYLAVEPETALAELKQGASLPSPATLAAYTIRADEIVDFSGGARPCDLGAELVELGCGLEIHCEDRQEDAAVMVHGGCDRDGRTSRAPVSVDEAGGWNEPGLVPGKHDG